VTVSIKFRLETFVEIAYPVIFLLLNNLAA